jgi:hypothetical protein
MSLHQNNKFILVHDKRCFASHWPPAYETDMLLITNFLELRVVAGISRMLAGRQHAIFGRTMLIYIYHAVPVLFPFRHPAATLPWPWEIAFKKAYSWHGRGTVRERHGNGMVCLNQTQPCCVNQVGKTQSKALAERHGRGTVWEQHGNGVGTTWYVWIGLKGTCLQGNI